MHNTIVIGVLTSVFAVTFLIHAFRVGLVAPTVNLLVFALSMLLTLIVYPPISVLTSVMFSISRSLTDIVSFSILFFVFFTPLQRAVMKITICLSIKANKHPKHVMEKLTGFNPAFATASIWLILIGASYNLLPISPFTSDTTTASIGDELAKAAIALDARPKQSFERTLENTIESLSDKQRRVYKPNIPIGTPVRYNMEAELLMLNTINNERGKLGLDELIFDNNLRDVARAHSLEMVRGNFVNHLSPITGTVSDRLFAAGILHFMAAENIVYTTDALAANKSIMGSKDHRDNLMNGRFGKIGIGIVDAGLYGTMVTQVLTN